MSKNIFVVIAGIRGVLYFSPVSEAKIMLAESELGLSFASEYVKFLVNYGALFGDNFSITGICKTEKFNVVSVTKKAREENPDFPKDMYVVEDTGVNRLLILQNRAGEIYSYMPGTEPQIIFNSLAEYLEDFYGGDSGV